MKRSAVVFDRGFLYICDIHTPPWEKPPASVYAAAQLCRERSIPLIVGGDGMDIIMHGVEAYEGSVAQQEWQAIFYATWAWYIKGNHEWKIKHIKRLFRSVTVVPYLDVEVNGVKWHLEHGDRYSLDWSWLRPVFNAVAGLALAISPRLWERFCRRWNPRAALCAGETDKYDTATDACLFNAARHARKLGASIVKGHTHKTDTLPRHNISVLDAGDARDGSAVLVGLQGQGEVIWLTNQR